MYPLIGGDVEGRTETRTPETEEEKLLASARNGDAAAFEALMLRSRRLVLAVTRRITGNLVEAEDVTQQAYMKAFANLSTFGGRCSFSTWVVRIAMNEARMWCRKTRRSREVAMTELHTGENFEMPPEFRDWRPDPETMYLQKERSRHLFTAMERLKPALREALQVCDLDEQSTIPAAVLLGITATSLKSRRLRGRMALRRKLESRLSPENRLSRKSAHDQATEVANQFTNPKARRRAAPGLSSAPASMSN